MAKILLVAAIMTAGCTAASFAASGDGNREARPDPIRESVKERIMPTIPASPTSPAAEAAPGAAPALPTVEYDPDTLPAPVRRLREQIIAAASTGDPEALRPIIDANGEPPAFSFNDFGDPIEFLKSLSGDPEGREILAILIEVLEAGFVHVDVGTAEEMYVWPYFARYPVDQLTPEQMVELFKIVFAGDYEDMKVFGAYISFRAGIAPDGTWRYFLAGD